MGPAGRQRWCAVNARRLMCVDRPGWTDGMPAIARFAAAGYTFSSRCHTGALFAGEVG